MMKSSCACGRSVAYTRKYSGESLCRDCFAGSIVRKATRTISKYSMIRDGQTVCAAVSGGKDSLALLKVLYDISKRRRFQIRAAIIDEGIPGYRDEALGIARGFCEELDVPLDTYSYRELFDITLEEALGMRGDKRISSCSACGILRRRAIDHAAAECGADVVATGHNLDDTLQTFLINMLSGDTERIGWTSPASGYRGVRRIKPFCEIYESEIVFYAFVQNIPFQTEPCPHMNEGIRTEIREFLNSLESGHSGIKNNLYRSFLRTAGKVEPSGARVRKICTVCGSDCSGEKCSVCGLMMTLGKPFAPSFPNLDSARVS